MLTPVCTNQNNKAEVDVYTLLIMASYANVLYSSVLQGSFVNWGENFLFRQSRSYRVGTGLCYVYVEFSEYMPYAKVFIVIYVRNIVDIELTGPWVILL